MRRVVCVNYMNIYQGAYATGQLEDSRRRNNEKMWRVAVHSQSYATFFPHSAVVSVPAVLLRKLPITNKTVYEPEGSHKFYD